MRANLFRKGFFRRCAGNRIAFHLEGDAYYRRYLELIRTAETSIHLQTYIFAADLFGREVLRELVAAAGRGVKVYLIIDSVGSMGFPAGLELEARQAGIHFCWFNGIRFKWLGQWGRRLHHKVLLADQRVALIGGINVISESYEKNPVRVPHQLDFAVEVEGPAIAGLEGYCRMIFAKACARGSEGRALARPWWKRQPGEEFTEARPVKDGVELQISINDWIYRRWQITRQYSEITKVAQKDILIVNSYFFPRRKFMKQLRAAAARGVRVRLVLPRFSDWPSYVKATQYLYSYFLKHGIEIYEWKKSIMHGKLATVDGRWSTVGSFNLNYTSYQQNLEMNVDVHTEAFTRDLNARMQELIRTGCERIEAEEFLKKSSWGQRASRFMFYLLLALIANFSIGLAVQAEKPVTPLGRVLMVGTTLLLILLGIVGMILPVIPGIPFFVVGVVLIYRQIRYNERNV